MTSRREAHGAAAELAAGLDQSRRDLMDAIAGLSEEGFRTRRGPSEWTAAEVLVHLLADEGKLTALAKAARETEPLVVPAGTEDERNNEARAAARRMPVPQVVHGLLARRRDTLALVESLSPAQLDLPVRHPAYGDVNVARLIQHVAEHEAEHAAQVRAARSQAEVNVP